MTNRNCNARSMPARLIGINSRNLQTLEVDLETAFPWQKRFRRCVSVAESGIHNARSGASAIRRLRSILIGESLMKASTQAKRSRS